MALIEVNELGKIYGNHEAQTAALNGVSFAIAAGEFVAIMGPSGSGKSTLLHILGLLDRATSGQYRYDGRPVEQYSGEQLARLRNRTMGFVFQAFNLLPRTSVLENVKLPLLYSAVPEAEWQERAAEAITAVELSHRIAHEPAQLSGGERQRVAIARALITRPQVIFADEPTGNLDTASGRRVMELLERLNREHGHTIILVTHEQTAAAYARRRIQLSDGRVEFDRATSPPAYARQQPTAL